MKVYNKNDVDITFSDWFMDLEQLTSFDATSLAKVKQAREKIENINPVYSTIGDRIPVLKNCDDIKEEVLAILDKLIAESED